VQASEEGRATDRGKERRETRGAGSARSSLEQMMSAMKEGNATEFPILVKVLCS
jgi:hypothetical protein